MTNHKQTNYEDLELQHCCINHFHLHEHIISKLAHYYIHYWRGEYLSTRIRKGYILVSDDNQTPTVHIKFLVIYQGCNEISVRKARQVKLSFRAISETKAYVIIRLVQDTIKDHSPHELKVNVNHNEEIRKILKEIKLFKHQLNIQTDNEKEST